MTQLQVTDGDAFAHAVLSHETNSTAFQPQVYFSEDGDCIEFFVSNDDYRAERIDSFVTIYYSRRTGDIIGSIVKGWKRYVAEVVKRTPGFKVEFGRKNFKLHRLFNAHLWSFTSTDDGDKIVKYEQLRDFAEEQKLDVAEGICSSK